MDFCNTTIEITDNSPAVAALPSGPLSAACKDCSKSKHGRSHNYNIAQSGCNRTDKDIELYLNINNDYVNNNKLDSWSDGRITVARRIQNSKFSGA